MKTSFCYHRYSSDLQRDKYTLAAQRRITKEIAKKYDSKIIQIYEDEALSGATIYKRPGMLQLLEDLPNLKPSYLIATDQDRLSRSNDFWLIKSKLAETNTSIITEKEGLIDQEDITKDALSDMLGVFAKLERKLIARRIKRAIFQRASEGKHNGNPPIGYFRKDGKLLINEIEYNQVIRNFELMIQFRKITTVELYLYNNNIKTPHGVPYSLKTLSRMFTNPIYIGKVRLYEKIYNGLHNPIIDENIFNEVNLIISKNRIVNPTKPASYLLSGYLKCLKCGSNLWGGNAYTMINQGKKHFVYRGYVCKNVRYGNCNNKISDKIEKIIFDRIKEKILDLKPNLEKGFEKYINQNSRKTKIKNIEDEIKQIDIKMSKLLDSFLNEIIDQKLFIEKNNQLKQIHENLVKNSNIKEDLNTDIYHIIKNYNIDNLFEELSFEAKRDILSLFINKIEVGPAKSRGSKDFNFRLNTIWNI